TISELAPDGVPLLTGEPKVIGYIPQRFRVYASRPTTDFSRMFPLIERAMQEDVLAILHRLDPKLVSAAQSPLQLGEIKDFGALATASQRQGVSLAASKTGTDDQRKMAKDEFAALARNIAVRVALEQAQ